jgi:ribosome-associated protein
LNLQGRELADRISQLVLEKKGGDVAILNLIGLSSAADYFIICSVDSDVQARAVMEHIKSELIYQTIKPWHTEGIKTSSWILMDFIDVVVHIFRPETREFYSLERLWGDAEIIHVKDIDETSGTHSE